ncbi:UDP-N-acetylmuramate dehydrogenase [Amycolatopsis acidiphila]|uniref:UDP-N-acetylenolpyruvoylglucosamine reductase n=1 Tax=Amycolatopsis acidiphila TaxID=715473 RepID=A0A558AN95_9PSEU|nr:UDP-N-acetylmuramate dehydrogenase [Amycolatopsis acidiphila]TVT25725.1 UDP-N-acetylmuramate dehydrogenase [Amycolatopsis acidiphila]UIJ60487.1 UDP-N-acetylmuramate dehydrogenase [Amycolatopsis acidiphila]GHG82620.1 UDP-N-acetylenolpyruvoylglucosamine reductase [Amycolatopsis acidiphila]
MTPVETRTALAEHTTLRLGGPARRFVVAETTEDLLSAVHAAEDRVLLLGGGSNLVVGDDGFDGTVVKIATRGWRVDGETVEVAAGQNWDEFVAAMVEAGLGGLECLSGIPGSVGATPIQNVGAYGCEVADLLTSVECYDRRTGETGTMSATDLGFAYRTSVLKGTDAGIVLSVRFALRGDGLSAPVRYAELARTLGVELGARVPAADARQAVLTLRRGKGMVLDAADHDTWSAGSFFTNPIVPEAELAPVLARIAEAVDTPVPQYPADGGVKLSAAWLIERAGFRKGHEGPGGRVTLSTKHTLALTNRGDASTADLLALAAEVRDGVRAKFGVTLHPEPLLINCSL